MRPFLLECGPKEVRSMYGHLIDRALKAHLRHGKTVSNDAVDRILTSLHSLIRNDASNHIKNCSQLFSVISKYASLGREQCRQLFTLDVFDVTLRLLLGIGMDEEGDVSPNRPRKWASSQSRELGELHTTLATLILACDKNGTDLGVQKILDGPLTTLYVREAVSACREVTSFAIPTISKALCHATSESSKFSHALTEELLRQYHSVSSGELKNLSSLLIEILVSV